MEVSLVFVGFLSLFSIAVTGQGTNGECGERPADVIFIMDSSGSISAADFQRQLRFVGDVINEFFIGADHTRVGAVSFSNWAFLDFYLDTYTDQGSIQAALGKIKQVRGDTNTPSAISYTRDVMFTATHGARQNVSHIAIIMTDGKSNEPKVTAKEAAKMRMYGIHVFAVGIGNGVDMEELHALATPPTVNNVFHVDDYIALPTIKDKLAIKTCGVTDLPLKRLPGPPHSEGCGNMTNADVVFALSPSASAEDTDKTLDFFRDVTEELNIGTDHIRVGMVPKDCSESSGMTQTEFDDQKDALNHMMRMMVDVQDGEEDASSKVLKYIREQSFSTRNGARKGAKRVAVVVVDEPLSRRAMKEASRARKHGINLIMIGVGPHVRQRQLDKLVGDSDHSKVHMIDSYRGLEEAIFTIREDICPITNES